MEIDDRISEIDRRIKNLNKTKEGLVGRLAVEERNRKEALTNLLSLGYDVDKYSAQELKDLVIKLQEELDNGLDEIETKLGEAEALVSKFKES